MTKPADKPTPERRIISTTTHFAILYGVLSLELFRLLYVYNDEIRHMAEATSRGDKTLFFVPIIIALVFSLVHGAFTGYFWEALGISAKKK
ncbi:hypothetical protein [Thiohalophilus sp.]|uniref:hypothetical protein n=1 Tax=Thiohalophilus sp. TaxID=3028392 RepID=UPI002ACE796C|nr:hypothetical protein [Thiohalophilus sp.]MDZ7802760.1 hypothetical protein [Thiohalophilus sp.]